MKLLGKIISQFGWCKVDPTQLYIATVGQTNTMEILNHSVVWRL